jgi:hypothetical protein
MIITGITEKELYEALLKAPIKSAQETACGQCGVKWWNAERAWFCLQSHDATTINEVR